MSGGSGNVDPDTLQSPGYLYGNCHSGQGQGETMSDTFVFAETWLQGHFADVWVVCWDECVRNMFVFQQEPRFVGS
jgi:hypothetical protein